MVLLIQDFRFFLHYVGVLRSHFFFACTINKNTFNFYSFGFGQVNHLIFYPHIL